MEPALSQVIEVVRDSSGEHRKPIDSNTLIEADLHICGIDGKTYWKTAKKRLALNLPRKKMATGKRSLSRRMSICLRVKA